MQLDIVRTERDQQIVVIRQRASDEVTRITTVRREQLIKVQAQMEEQLKNIREQRYDQLEKVMRKCEGGRERGGSLCPATAAPVVEETTEANAENVARAVNETLAEAGITSEYRVSLAWESTADLDIFVENSATGEVIFYANKVSSNGAMELDIDQQAGSAGQHVENISFDGGVHADYNVYVTNYATNSDQGEIHFVVVTKQGQTVETFEDSWDIGAMGIEQHNRLENMMAITTVHVVG